MKKTILIFSLAIGLFALNPASATHGSSKGTILIGGGPQSFCSQAPFPGFSTHGIYSVSEACLAIPAGANGMSLSYSPKHPHVSLGCEKLGDTIRVYGNAAAVALDYSTNPPTPIAFAPTVAQPFTITWLHGSLPDWSPCGL